MTSRFPSSRGSRKTNPALDEARRLHKLPKRKPTDADRPPVRPAPGPRIKPLPGQLDFDGNEVA